MPAPAPGSPAATRPPLISQSLFSNASDYPPFLCFPSLSLLHVPRSRFAASSGEVRLAPHPVRSAIYQGRSRIRGRQLQRYENYDITGQQLINARFVVINGARVGLDLQSAEAVKRSTPAQRSPTSA